MLALNLWVHGTGCGARGGAMMNCTFHHNVSAKEREDMCTFHHNVSVKEREDMCFSQNSVDNTCTSRHHTSKALVLLNKQNQARQPKGLSFLMVHTYIYPTKLAGEEKCRKSSLSFSLFIFSFLIWCFLFSKKESEYVCFLLMEKCDVI